MSKPLWTFEQYVTEAGGHPVEDWYQSELEVDERDLIRDRIGKLENVERPAWRRPGFDKLDGDICEIRKDTPDGTIRIYGYFPPNRYHFVLLHGHYKKVDNDRRGMRVAKDRLKLIRSGKGRLDGFSFEEGPTGTG
jgi:phage-related protein